MIKQALLITAYKNFEHLQELVRFFDDPLFSIYIHIDVKSDINEQDLISLQRYNVTLVRKYKVNWGGLNHLKAYLLLSKLALEEPSNSYFHLISGQDFPVKSLNFFKLFIEREAGLRRGYLRHEKLPNKNWFRGGMDRLMYYNLYDVLDAKKHKKLIRKIVRLQIKIGFVRPFYKNFPQLYGGSTYWTLPREILEYVFKYTDQNPRFLKRFSHSFCAEEIYFQTIILNSTFKDQVVNNNLRYIDWSKGRGSTPVFLDERDYDVIMAGDYLFARKFDERSNGIKQLILEHLNNTYLNNKIPSNLKREER